MYKILILIIFIAILFVILFHWKKKKIIRKICCLSMHDKCQFLNELVEPLGYQYDIHQDIFTSTIDAWQKHYGYTELYDKAAPYTGMIFDCQPVYFNYDDKTWLIEFWKGQYGINTGSEVGVYHADTIIPPKQLDKTLFSAVAESDFLDIKTSLFDKGMQLAELSATHWWLTIFSMGRFSKPANLTMDISIRFPNLEMRDAYVDGLLRAGYHRDALCICFTTVTVTFETCRCHRSCLKKPYCTYVQLKNRIFCWLYRFVTRPFKCTCDRLLYLYYFFPFAFRRMLRLKRFRKRRHKHP